MSRGFSVLEAIIALTVTTMLILVTFSHTEAVHFLLERIARTPYPVIKPPTLDPAKEGDDVCFLDGHSVFASTTFVGIPHVTSALQRGGYTFVTADTSNQSDPDLYILKQGAVESALSTGPGLRDISIVRNTAYVANTSANSQVQKIDLSDIHVPRVVGAYKYASTGNAVYFHKGYVYIGSEKAYGPELAILDRSLGSVSLYETDSQINDIYKDDALYIAASDMRQLHILGTSTSFFSPSGWETQEGKVIRDGYFGRTVGGFNNKANHELFLLGSTSVDIGFGVYGIVSTADRLFVATRDLQVYKKPLTYLYSIPLRDTPVSLACDQYTLVVGLRSGVQHIYFSYAH